MNTLTGILLTGTGATLVMDLWCIARQPLLGVPRPNYGLVGRWVGHMARGHFRHEAIGRAAPIAGERALGWCVHYATGIAFAALLVAITGVAWLREPTLLPALLVGIGTVAAPFLLMQPGMGAGIAASRTPDPRAARIQSVITHAVFGAGMYLSALAASVLAAH